MASLRAARRATVILTLLGLASLGPSCEPSPYAPTNLRLGPPYPGACGIEIEWDAPEQAPPSGIQSYIIRRNGAVARVASWVSRSFYDSSWLGLAAGTPTYRYEVSVLDGDGVEHPGISGHFEISNCPAPAPQPVLETVVLLMNFPDNPVEPFTPDAILDVLYGEGDSVATQWEANSYGRQVLEPTGDGVIGWVTMPHPISEYCAVNPPGGSSSGCELGQMQEDALVATGPFPNPWWGRPVDRVLVVYAGLARSEVRGMQLPSSTWIPGAVFSTVGALQRSTIVHELGHASGLPHANGIACAEGVFPPDIYDETSGDCTAVPYGDRRDPMGSDTRPSAHFNAFYKEMLGFLPPDRIQTVIPGLTGEVRLYRLQDDIDGTQLLKVWTTHWGGTGYLLVQYGPGAIGSDVVQIRVKPGRRAVSLYGTELSSPSAPAFVDAVQHVRIDWLSSGIDAKGRYALIQIETQQ